MPRILIVDDEPGIRQSLKGVFEDEGFSTDAVSSGEDCLKKIEQDSFDLVLLDIWLPGIDGLETLRKLREKSPLTHVIMISGHATIATAVSATKLGAYDFIEKPLSLEKTLLSVARAIEHSRLEGENRALRERLERGQEIVGQSPAIQEMRRQIAIAAPTNGRVLVHGENGSGKELVARAVHALSARRDGPFVEVNCAAIPEELIESELFGHEKGAFTGSVGRRKGKFELGNGGTLFLDEVGDMSLKTQAKVLRVLEEQAFERVGGTEQIKTDVRVIAASNQNLADLIAAGRFSDDLFYRLNVIPVEVPPLRQRKEDIPLLVEHFIRVFSLENGKRPKTVSVEALAYFLAYDWPGNVRELRNMVERLVIMTPRGVIGLEDLPPPVRPKEAGLPQDQIKERTLKEAREAFEKAYILAELRAQDWNMTRTSERLGIERSHLYRKLKTYRITPPK